MSEREFEETLDRLSAERTDAEQRYFAALQEYRERMTRLTARAADAEAAAARIGGWPGRAESGAVAVDGVATELALDGPDPWPANPGLRGRINALLRWLLRDYLEVLDRREERLDQLAARQRAALLEHHRALEQVAAGIEPRLRAALDYSESIGDVAARTHALTEALRETVESLRSGLDQLEPLAERLRLLGDAKHAEVLRRATEGPVRRTELLFDELERRQEALLARLARAADSPAGRDEDL